MPQLGLIGSVSGMQMLGTIVRRDGIEYRHTIIENREKKESFRCVQPVRVKPARESRT